MTDFNIQTQIEETLDTINNLLKCLNKEQMQEPRNQLLGGVLAFYKTGNFEAFSIVMLELCNQTAIYALKTIKKEIYGEE